MKIKNKKKVNDEKFTVLLKTISINFEFKLIISHTNTFFSISLNTLNDLNLSQIANKKLVKRERKLSKISFLGPTKINIYNFKIIVNAPKLIGSVI